jgi:cytoskeleton protein RodZ
MGAILKRCREYHGISIEEAAETTKIGANYLKALESDHLKEFPSLAYLKGFLRIYATYLGLNADDIIRICEKQYAPAGAARNSKPGASDSEPVRRRLAWRKLVLPAFLLALLLVTAAILNRSSTVLPRQAPPKPVAGTVPVPPVLPARSSTHPAPAVQKPKADSAPAAPAKTEATRTERVGAKKPPAETGKGFIVRMKVTNNGTLAVTIDGAAVQNYDLTVGDIIEWKAEKNITLELSNAGGIEAELNGKPLKPFGPSGKPAYVVLDADGVKQ